jgi:hypothetical protein
VCWTRFPSRPKLDNAALMGWPVAASHLRFDGHPTTIYTRTRDDAVVTVQAILARTANPEHPNEVKVSRPSDALAAKEATDSSIAVASGYAGYQDWPTVVPAWVTGGAVVATLVIGGCAGIYPAWRAARLSPTEALATP